MQKKKNTTLWIALSAVAAACPSLFCVVSGIATLAGGGTYEVGSSSGQLSPAFGLVFLCLGGLPWLLPLGVWYVSRKKARNAAPVTSMPYPTRGAWDE